MTAPPAFQFYASDFVGGTMGFNAEQTGAYILLLCYQWMNGSVPDDDDALAAVGRCSRLAIAVLRRKFVPAPDGSGLINERLEEVRIAQQAFLSKQAESGRKGGLAKQRASSEPQASLKRASSSPISYLHSPVQKVQAPSEPQASLQQAPSEPSVSLIDPSTILLHTIGELYGRTAEPLHTYPYDEQKNALAVIHRQAWEQELNAIRTWYRGMKPEDHQFRPHTIRTLLENWQSNVDRANTYKAANPVRKWGVRGIL